MKMTKGKEVLLILPSLGLDESQAAHLRLPDRNLKKQPQNTDNWLWPFPWGMPAPGASNQSVISRTHKTLDTARTCRGDQPPPAAWALLFPTHSDYPEPILRVT